MKKLLPLLVLLCLPVSVVFSTDVGVDVSTSAGFKTSGKVDDTNPVTISGSFTPSPWVDLTLGDYSHFYMKLGINLPFSSNPDAAKAFPVFPLMFDLTEFKIESKEPKAEIDLNTFDIGLGRFSWSDPTGSVFSHRLDGLSLSMGYAIGTVSIVTGYTGLLWRHNSGVEMSNSDLAIPPMDLSKSETYFAAPRFIGAFVYRTPKILNGSLYVMALVQEDLRNGAFLVPEWQTEQDKSGKGGAFDTQYLSAGVEGNAGPAAFKAFFTFNTGRYLSYLMDTVTETYHYEYIPIQAMLAGVSGSYMILKENSLSVSGRFQFGSGNENAADFFEGNSTKNPDSIFRPVTGSGSGLIFTPQPGNLILVNLSGSMLPFADSSLSLMKKFQTSVSAFTFFRTTLGPISQGINVNSKSGYLGSEVDASLSVSLFSDLNASLSLGMFLPNGGTDGTFLPSAAAPQFSGRLSVTFSM